MLVFVTSIVLGIMFKSWWAVLITWVVLISLSHYRATVGIVSFFWGLLGGAIGGAMLSEFGSGGMAVGGLIGFALAWVPMRASEQYWRDLESDGGPYSD